MRTMRRCQVPARILALLAASAALVAAASALAPVPMAWAAPATQTDTPGPPDQVIKLIFIHHSCGENWLRDDYGGLGLALAENNYFVSDTNYGWGPDSIGDRTDIPDWLEWFRGGESEGYLQALYAESGQHSEYTRTLADPGGENEIVLFKSCFPNSNLEGDPDDPPAGEAGYSVAGAKYVYNQLLEYFASRPDKLFVIITAPPVSDPTYAENARAFNNWLLYDWLQENAYSLNNVAVFDFYNVLTGSEHHHRYANGQIEHVYAPGHDTAAYPSDDDHPSAAGSRKATQEFVPLLNVYFHRWQADRPAQPPVEIPAPGVEELPPAATGAPMASGRIDDFESGPPPGTSGWEPNWDASTPTTITCAPTAGESHDGGTALRIDYDVAANSWATCALFFESAQDWTAGSGLTFNVRGQPEDLSFDVDLYAGDPEAMETYLFSSSAADAWTTASLAWSDLLRAAWEDGAGEPFGDPTQVRGLAFGFSSPEGASTLGTLWIDDLRLAGGQISPPAGEPEAKEEAEPSGRPGLPCMGALALPMVLAAAALGESRRRGAASSTTRGSA